MKAWSVWLPVTDEQLADCRPSPNVCEPWTGHGCFIHTVPSWRCGGYRMDPASLSIIFRARDEASRALHAFADRIAATSQTECECEP